MNDHFVVAVTDRSIAFSKLNPRNGNLGESHAVALSPQRRTPEGVIDAIGDWMQRHDAEFDRIWITCADPALRQGLAAVLKAAVGPGWLDRVALQSGGGGPAAHDMPQDAHDMPQDAVARPKNRRSVIAMGGAAIAGAPPRPLWLLAALRAWPARVLRGIRLRRLTLQSIEAHRARRSLWISSAHPTTSESLHSMNLRGDRVGTIAQSSSSPTGNMSCRHPSNSTQGSSSWDQRASCAGVRRWNDNSMGRQAEYIDLCIRTRRPSGANISAGRVAARHLDIRHSF